MRRKNERAKRQRENAHKIVGQLVRCVDSKRTTKAKKRSKQQATNSKQQTASNKQQTAPFFGLVAQRQKQKEK